MAKWRRTLYGLVAFLAIQAFALAVAFAQPVTITVWDTLPSTSRDVFLELIDEFNSRHPDINVEVEYVTDYWTLREKFTIALAANVPPNVVHHAHVQAYSFRLMGVFMPLNDYIEKDPTMDMDDWYPPLVETVSYDGNIYGIPYNISTPLTYFSPQLLEESGLEPRAPATWDEMLLMGPRITRDLSGEGTPTIWAMDTVREPGWLMEAFVGQAGGTTVNADRTELTLNSPESIRAFQFQQDLIHRHRISRYPGAPGADLNSGRVGWWFRSSASLRSRLESAFVPIDVAPLPCDVKCHIPIGGGALYAVDTGTQAERDATYKLLSFLAEPDNLARYAAASGYLAGRRSAIASEWLQDTFREHPQFLVTYEQLGDAYPETQAPEWGKIQDLWNDRPGFLDPIFRDNRPVEPTLDDLVRKGNAILREFWEAHGKK